MKKKSFRSFFTCFAIILVFISFADSTKLNAQTKTDFFIRFKVLNPTLGEKFRVSIGGFRHEDPWYFPEIAAAAEKDKWSEWINLSDWKWHKRLKRSGGIAEWGAIRMIVSRIDAGEAVKDSAFAVELADVPSEKNVVVSFTEKSASNIIAFLAPNPLRENAKEFETGSQMTARHAKWAQQVSKNKPVVLKKFELISQIWGHYDPNLERQEIATLKMLGINSIGGIKPFTARETNTPTYSNTWLYHPDPDYVQNEWTNFAKGTIATEKATADGKWKYDSMRHWVISDEVSGLDFRNVEPAKVNLWFREYLKSKNVTAQDLGKPIDEIKFPAKLLYEPFLLENVPLETRKLYYHAAKFNQWWSAKQLKQISDLIKTSLPNVKTETLLPSHGFFGNAWSPAHIGMSYRMLDFFEVGAQNAVNQMSAEDWLGLNHMYWENYTWTGGQTFGYFNALLRSSISQQPIELRGLITPSDDDYLQLKAHSSLGQGAKSFFFWTFGPTYIGTENYWSDLQSEYEGIAKLSRTLAKSEDVLMQTKPASDAVAISYSVSHDIWNTDNHTAFVEKRLLWHALKHLQIQPDFLREEDIENGKLADYKVLYLTDWLVSRKASAKIDEWVKQGGTLYLSAGAATRDEFSEPFLPEFAKAAWDENAAKNFVSEKHNYNERIDLPKIKPLTTATVNLADKSFALPVIGARLDLKANAESFAKFADGKTAGAKINYGRGKIIAVGFLPMLAYGQQANFKPTTLEEKWTSEPREIVKTAIDEGKTAPVIKSNTPVVEADLLVGEQASAIVLANYTYAPIKNLTLEVNLPKSFKSVTTTEGAKVKTEKLPDGRTRLTLPLKWTDIILIR